MSTRNLGALTIDLIADVGGFVRGLNDSEQSTEAWQQRVSRSTKVAGKAFAAVSVAAAGSLALMTSRVVDQAAEIEILSAVANTSTEEFQRMAYGAQRYGVEQDKVADILKDTSDKVGDFLQNGAGPLKDFFDKIAPQVGVTAEEFRDLSGREALGLYVSSLEKANLSQNEMTFYMEAIASDATLLLPLLRNNGKELGRLGDEAEDVGAVLSDLDLQQLGEVRENLDKLKGAFDGFEKEIVTGALPAIKDLTDLLQDPDTIEGATALANGVIKGFSAVTKVATGTANVIKFLAEETAAFFSGPHADDIVRLEDTAQRMRDILDGNNFGDRIRLFGPTGLVEYWDDEELKAELAYLESMIDAYYNPATKTNAKTPAEITIEGELLGDDFQQAIAEAESELKQLAAMGDPWEIFSDTLGELEGELEVEAEQRERMLRAQQAFNSLVADLQTDEERNLALLRERLDILEAVHDITDEQRQQTLGRIVDAAVDDSPALGGLDSGEDIESARTELEDWYSTQLDMLEQFRSERADLNAAWDDEELAIRQQYEEKLTEISQANEDLRRQQQLEGYSTLMSVASEYYSGMESQEAAYMRAALTLGQTLLDEKKRNALESIIANTQDAAMGAYSALSSIYIVGPALGAAAAGSIYVAGGLAAAKLTGMAHHGIDAVPEDGTWLLQKGERVTTSETSAKLDRTLAMIQADMHGGGRGGSSAGAAPFTQNISVTGKLDNRTASQIAREGTRQQRINRRRLGS
ncbi:hypothetical protein ACJJIF_06940 [Microbulbifer sp. SSSA002]|uniref:hypothetical protein n=1 Tax=Microbulbifer sp. SSSA002 TaxID=3243376 RepID=UPI0040393083